MSETNTLLNKSIEYIKTAVKTKYETAYINVPEHKFDRVIRGDGFIQYKKDYHFDIIR